LAGECAGFGLGECVPHFDPSPPVDLSLPHGNALLRQIGFDEVEKHADGKDEQEWVDEKPKVQVKTSYETIRSRPH
jgi:hypothetical protein